jgi:putative NIF3 family GTP cyclohydrolase 1 type 2
MLIQEYIDAVTAWLVGGPKEKTLDTVKCGDPGQELRGVVVTFMATWVSLRQAAETGVNLLITHEPSFYNHLDETEWLEGDAVYEAKKAFLAEHGIVLWRVHDYIHQMRPDGIYQGITEALGWPAVDPDMTLALPKTMTLGALAEFLKAGLGISTVKVCGPRELVCERIGLRLGAPGGRSQIMQLRREDVQAVICGESAEWEACEYVRDSVAIGRPRGLIVMGHANSEEAGMEWLYRQLAAQGTGGVPVHYVPAGDPFYFV